MRILVIEDELKTAEALRRGLRDEGFEVSVATSGEEGFYLLHSEEADLVILDLMLPKRDGLEILSALRKRGDETRILVLTARDTIDDRVRGLETGADDYLTKPFAFSELLARVRALLRRGGAQQDLSLQADDLHLDLMGRRAKRGGEVLSLTAREFQLLEYLMRHKDQIVSRQMLTEEVWQETARATPLDNVIDVHIARLRKKLDQNASRKLLHTVRGLGFILKEKAD